MSLKTDLISVMSWETLLSTSFSNPSVDRLMFPEDTGIEKKQVNLITHGNDFVYVFHYGANIAPCTE